MATEIWQYKVQWGGWSGGPGYSVFRAMGTDTAQAHADAVRKFLLDALSTLAANLDFLPTNVVLTFPSTMDRVDADTNTMIGTVGVAAPATITGLAASGFAAPTGAAITWTTGDFHDGRRVVGRTFLVPLSNAAYQNDGSLLTTCLDNIRAAAATYIADPTNQPVVMSRLTTDHPGGAHIIVGGSVSDKAAVLRSRRD